MRLVAYIFCVLIIISLTGCEGSRITGTEGGSQTTNGIVVRVIYHPDHHGKPAALQKVTIRPTDSYQATADQPGVVDTMTDESGYLRVELPTGIDYSIEVSDQVNHAVLIRLMIAADSSKTYNLGNRIMEPFSVIKGRSPAGGQQGYIQVAGLERHIPSAPDGTFEIRDLPSRGPYDFRFISADTTQPRAYVKNFRVFAADTAHIVFTPGWPNQVPVRINTAPGGADIKENITQFPLLVRLRPDNFCMKWSCGQFIRFTDAADSTLDYEIEKWDKATGSADIWVTVPLIKAQNSSQYIILKWREHEKGNVSNSRAVFSQQNEFRSVWHLAASENLYPNSVTLDSVAKKAGGNPPADTSGIIARAAFFSGDDSWINLGTNLDYADGIESATMSAWFFSFDTTTQRIFTISENNTTGDPRLLLGLDRGMFPQAGGRSNDGGPLVGHTPRELCLGYETWYHFAGVVNFKADKISMYINGELWSEVSPAGFSKTASGPATSTYAALGANAKGDTLFFHGILDEARLSHTERSPSWIKLCYENQRPDKRIVTLKN